MKQGSVSSEELASFPVHDGASGVDKSAANGTTKQKQRKRTNKQSSMRLTRQEIQNGKDKAISPRCRSFARVLSFCCGSLLFLQHSMSGTDRSLTSWKRSSTAGEDACEDEDEDEFREDERNNDEEPDDGGTKVTASNKADDDSDFRGNCPSCACSACSCLSGLCGSR